MVYSVQICSLLTLPFFLGLTVLIARKLHCVLHKFILHRLLALHHAVHLLPALVICHRSEPKLGLRHEGHFTNHRELWLLLLLLHLVCSVLLCNLLLILGFLLGGLPHLELILAQQLLLLISALCGGRPCSSIVTLPIRCDRRGWQDAKDVLTTCLSRGLALILL